MSDPRKKSLTVRQKAKIWLNEHLRCFLSCLGHFKRYGLNTFLTIAVIAITLAIPAGLSLILDNVGEFTTNLTGNNQISVYLRADLEKKQVDNFEKKLRSESLVQDLAYISREQALKDYQKISGHNKTLQLLGENPLPASFQITPKPDTNITDLERLIDRIGKRPETDEIVFDSDWAMRINSIIQLLQKFDAILSLFLWLAVLLIIGNTIRVDIQNRHQEIQISRLFGASHGFIRRPFLHTGALYGLLGGLIAGLLLLISSVLLSKPVFELFSMYSFGDKTDFELYGDLLRYSMGCIIVGMILGVCSAWCMVFIYQKNLENNDFS